MDFSQYTAAQPPSLNLPKIFVQGSSPSHPYGSVGRSMNYNSIFSPSTTAKPMSIPHTRTPPAPPPLPPPKFTHFEDDDNDGASDPGWQWEESRQGNSWGRSPIGVNPGSSLCGGFTDGLSSGTGGRPNTSNKRTGSDATIKSISDLESRRDVDPRLDEGYVSLSGTSIGSNLSRPRSRPSFQSSVHDKYRSNTQTYDKFLIQKLDAQRGTDNATPPRAYPTSPFSSSLNDVSPSSRTTHEHLHSQQKPFSMPILATRMGSVEKHFTHWSERGTPALSPPGHHSNGHHDYRSSSDRDELERSPLPYLRHSASGSLGNSEDVPTYAFRANRESERTLDTDADFHLEETSRLRRLRIDDSAMRLEGQSPTFMAGQKRRASSPLKDEIQPALHTVGSASDLFRRREAASRASPTPRLHSSHGSVSSTGSVPRNSSYVSSLSVAPSSITSASSYGRLSPVGLSPGGVSPRSNDGSNESPHTTSSSLTASPHGSVSSPNHPHAMLESRPVMTTRKSSDRGISQVKRESTDKARGVFICECCPKKPKKFDTEEELNAHEMEKQYECHYCKNRFKNKNEAERHQNSLHLRRHSWSCAALSDYSAAYHNSPARPTDADSCGYCGEEFTRTGATALDGEARIKHLVDIHKFRECNNTKKFFRADHFRQHLKHSHAGTSGKWTNMLENACMKDEPLPEYIPSRITEEEEDVS